MDETQAFLTALTTRLPDDPTACTGWRVRDLVAHLTAGAREEADLIEAALRGEPRDTRGFAEREADYHTVAYRDLLAALADHSARLTTALGALAAAGERVTFTGAHFTAADFHLHSRSELALHRFDLIGDDETGRRLLAQPELTAHAVRVLTEMPSLAESLARRGVRSHRFAVRLAAAGTPDVRVELGPEPFVSQVTPGSDEPRITVSPSDRLLLLWGRRPASIPELSAVPKDRHESLQAFFAGPGNAQSTGPREANAAVPGGTNASGPSGTNATEPGGANATVPGGANAT